MGTPFTKVADDESMSSQVIWNELVRGVWERCVATGVDITNFPKPASQDGYVLVGEDLTRVDYSTNPFTRDRARSVRGMQVFLQSCFSWLSGFYNQTQLPADNNTIDFQSNHYNLSSAFTAAGLSPSGWRRATVYNPNIHNWKDVNDVMWTGTSGNGFGTQIVGDIWGPWLIDDLQKIMSAMKYVVPYSTDQSLFGVGTLGKMLSIDGATINDAKAALSAGWAGAATFSPSIYDEKHYRTGYRLYSPYSPYAEARCVYCTYMWRNDGTYPANPSTRSDSEIELQNLGGTAHYYLRGRSVRSDGQGFYPYDTGLLQGTTVRFPSTIDTGFLMGDATLALPIENPTVGIPYGYQTEWSADGTMPRTLLEPNFTNAG